MPTPTTALTPCPECKGPRTVEDLNESYQVFANGHWEPLCGTCHEALVEAVAEDLCRDYDEDED